jgi:hypothetical protein
MKNLELEKFGVQELDAKEMKQVDGGMGYDAGGYGLVYGRSKGDGAFYKGVFKGLYDAFFK